MGFIAHSDADVAHRVCRLLRKNPFLMIMDTVVARTRFNKLHHITPLSHEASRIMVVKYPLALNRCVKGICCMIELPHPLYIADIMNNIPYPPCNVDVSSDCFSRTETVAAKTEKLRHLAYTRAMWQQDFDCITPSLMAFFLRDYR